MSRLDPYLYKVTDANGNICTYSFKEFLGEVLGIETIGKNAYHTYLSDLFHTAHKLVDTAKSVHGVNVWLEVDPDWEEVFVFEKSRPKAVYTFRSFEYFEKTVAEDCGVKLYVTTVGEELNRQWDLFSKDHTNLGAVLGVKSLIGIVHDKGPGHKVYVSLADGSNPDQRDTCEVLYEDELHGKMILLKEVARRAGCSVRRDVQRKPETKVEVSIPKSDDNFLRSRSLNTQQVAQNAVDAAIRKLKGEK